jgi:hypothetical protein
MISDRTLRRVIPSDSTVALVGDLVRVLIAVVLIGLTAYYVAYYVAFGRVLFRELHMNDFGKFYYSARAFLDGTDMYAPSPATAMPVGEHEVAQFANMNPPHFHLVILPIARLAPMSALLVWLTASVLALLASVRIGSRELGFRWTLPKTVWAVAAFVVSSATETVIVTGQVTFLLLLPFTLSWVNARRGRWTTSALYLGILTSIKPFFAIFVIYLLARKRAKEAAAMAITTVACFLIGITIFGWDNYRSWLGALSNVQWAWAVMNGSLVALLARTLDTNPFFQPLIRMPELIAPLGALGGALVIVVVCVSLVCDRGPGSTDRAFGLLVLTALLASPLGWIYYAWLLLPPLAALWISGPLRRWPIPSAFLLLAIPGLLYPLRFTLVAQNRAWGSLLPGSIYSLTMLCLWAAVLTTKTRCEETSEREPADATFQRSGAK